MKKIIYLSGLPRTGSTVLASLLNQHPDIHATTTSPVADLADIVLTNWMGISGAIKDRNSSQYGNILDGVIQGAHKHIEKPTIVDKNRLWPRMAPDIYAATGKKPQIICTVRSIVEIMASYLLLIDKNGHGSNFIDQEVIKQGLTLNTKTRCKILLEKFINHPYNSLRIGHNSGTADIMYVEYNSLVGNPQTVLDSIYGFIGCSSYAVDTNNLQPMDENDEFHGGLKGLHHVRPKLARVSPPPEEVLGKELASYYNGMRLEFWHNSTKKDTITASKAIAAKKANIARTQTPTLEGDSLDYDLLWRAASKALQVDGLFCEIGVRRGGSLKYIIDAIATGSAVRTVVAIDPYGNIEYNATQMYRGRLDYTNEMKHESLPHIYRYADQAGLVNLVFFNLEDTEFFNRFSDGVPVYDGHKSLNNTYAFVFFDGPHDVDSIQVELDFFMDRINPGSVFVFDDVATYPHDIVHNRLLANGFTVLENGVQGRKISYIWRGIK